MILSFKPQFKEKILSGQKIHTLRLDPLNRWEVGMVAQMATGVRTKNYNCFKEATIKTIQKVKLQIFLDQPILRIDGRHITGLELRLFALNDGFESFEQLVDFFRPQLELSENKIIKIKLLIWTNHKY